MSETTVDIEGYVWTEERRNLWGSGWEGRAIDTECPVIVRGEIDGLPFYFSSRYDGWTFCVAKDQDSDPYAIFVGDEIKGYYHHAQFEGKPGYAGLITSAEAHRIIEQAANDYRGFQAFCDRNTVPAPSFSEMPTLRPIPSVVYFDKSEAVLVGA